MQTYMAGKGCSKDTLKGLRLQTTLHKPMCYTDETTQFYVHLKCQWRLFGWKERFLKT